MEATTRVDVVFAVCGTERRLIYGKARLRHIVADGEAQQLVTVEVPIGRPESAQVLEAVFADYGVPGALAGFFTVSRISQRVLQML